MGNTEGKYKYADRQVPYRSETLEISKDEHKLIKEYLKVSQAKAKLASTAPLPTTHQKQKQKIIFDTDIGTDIDDALALLMLLHVPEEDAQILGITTVYGHTGIRAHVAKTIVDAYFEGKGTPSTIPVIAGEGVPLGTHRNVWHTGTEGAGVMTLKEIDEMIARKRDNTHEAAQFIIKQVLENPGEVVLLGLGGLTNIATAMRMNKKIVPLIKRIVYMGMGHQLDESQTAEYPFQMPGTEMDHGNVYFHYPNHNISCDTLAAMIVFRSGAPVTVVNDKITNSLWFGMRPSKNPEQSELTKDPTLNPCAALMEATSPPECKVVGLLLKCWLDYRSSIFYTAMRGTCPHDAVTAIEAVYPGRFAKYKRGWLLIHEWAGFSSFVVDPNGPHEIGVSVEADKFMSFLVPLLVPFWTSPPATPAVAPAPTPVASPPNTVTSTSPEEPPQEKDSSQEKEPSEPAV